MVSVLSECCCPSLYYFGACVQYTHVDNIRTPQIALYLIDKITGKSHSWQKRTTGFFNYTNYTELYFDFNTLSLSYVADLKYSYLSCNLFEDVYYFDETFDNILTKTLSFECLFLKNYEFQLLPVGYRTNCRTFVIGITYYGVSVGCAVANYDLQELNSARDYFKAVILNPAAYIWL